MAPRRLLSLDAFRGATIIGMIVVNHPGTWEHVYPPLRHARWHGITPTDWIFPFFIFITGISLTLSLTKRKESGAPQGALIRKILVRGLVIFLLGLLLYLSPRFEFATMRIPGVLQRIAVVYVICALLFLKTNWRTQVAVTIAILIGYWLLMTVVPVPGIGPANLEPTTNLGAWLDVTLMNGHLWTPDWDPEGLLSTLPAVATGLLGVLTGTFLRRKEKEPAVKVVWMFVFGCLFVFLGSVWHWIFPINKNLWTSSYVLYTAGLALFVFALCYWFADVLGYRGWTKPFVVYGTNAITIYMAAHLLSGWMVYSAEVTKAGGEVVSLYTWLYETLFAAWLSPINASLAFALVYTFIWMLPLWIMYKRKIFIKV
jgi:predicted acyltransferase